MYVDERELRIMFGQCCNLAVDVMKNELKNVASLKNFEEEYKLAVTTFFKWNLELQNELLMDYKNETANKAINPTPAGATGKTTKKCEKCGKEIPSSYNAHFACGWKEGQ